MLNWCCPPVYLIPRTLRYAKACKASGTLLVPYWPSAVFWPMVCAESDKFADFVLEVFELPQVEDTIVPGRRGHSIAAANPNFRILALRFQF